MRPVNLLPQSARPKQGGGRPGSAYVIVGALAALLIGVLVYVLTANQITSKQDELAKLQRETTAAEAQAAALGSFGDFATIKQTREASVAALAQARLDWERLMRELSRVLPEDVFVNALDATAGGAVPAAGSTAPSGGTPGSASLTLAGCAPSQRDVATLLVRLRRLSRASEVKLTDSTRVDGDTGGAGKGCGAGYSWNAVVSIDPAPVAAAPERVPAHLGGGS
jgi:Tfp pilus assembly protein PilN